jgi:GNAT superfamily N-acetyltransferase
LVTEVPALAFDGEATETLLAAMEGNMTAHMAYLPRFLPVATVLDGPDLVLVDAGLPSDTLNTICKARLDPAIANARIAAAIDHFRASGRPFTWWVGAVSRPADLGARLVAHGLVEAEAEIGMALDLARLPELSLPDGLVVRRVTTLTELMDYAGVVAANWDPPDRAVVDFYDRVAEAVLTPGCPAWHYVGYLDGEPVATSECFLGCGVAGLYAVVTLPRARRRGIGSAMTAAPLLDARAAGYRTATLQASAGGQGVYARLGFLPCATFREYKPRAD